MFVAMNHSVFFSKRYIFACRYLNLIPRFDRRVPGVFMIANFIYSGWIFYLATCINLGYPHRTCKYLQILYK